MSESPPSPDRLSAWLAEFRRRGVFRVTGAYVFVGWILMQAGEIAFPAFELPIGALRILIVSLVAGLPCVIASAWFFDVTPMGIRLTSRPARLNFLSADGEAASAVRTVSEEESSSAEGGRSLEILLLGIVVPLFAFVILLAYFAFGIEGVTSGVSSLPTAQLDAGVPSLAVLPFEDLSSARSDGGFFARGMHEDILTRLSRVHPLKLISRTSVMGYEGTNKNLRQVGQELGVNHILEGSVRRTETRVRVTAQLIRADTDEPLWARNFDAELEDVFAVQSQIADAIAVALEAEFAPNAVETLGAVVPAAYDAYLKARDLHRNLNAEDQARLARIRHLYETALQADPTLAAAHLQLAILHAQARWFEFDLSGSADEFARTNLAAAVRIGIEPDEHALAEGVLAYYLDRDYGKALLYFEDAVRRAPNNAEAIFYRGMILRRTGQLDTALQVQRAALELDPLNLAHRDELALTLALAGELKVARSELRSILLVDPNRSRAQLQKWQLDLELDGQPERVLEDMLSKADEGWQDPQYSLLETAAVLAGDPKSALEQIVHRMPANPDAGFRDYQLAVLQGFSGNPTDKKAWLDRAWRKFLALRSDLGWSEGRRGRADSVEALLSAQSGDFERALLLQQSLVDRFPIERDLIEGGPPLWQLLDLQLRAGRVGEAGKSLERLAMNVAPGSILNGGYFVLARWPEYENARADAGWSALLKATAPPYVENWSDPARNR